MYYIVSKINKSYYPIMASLLLTANVAVKSKTELKLIANTIHKK